jgi:hypothetical protein
VLHSNHRVLTMIADHWPAARCRRSRECAIISVELPPVQPYQPRVRPAPPGARRPVALAAAGRV